MRGECLTSLEMAIEAFKKHVFEIPSFAWNKCFDKWFESMHSSANLKGEYFEKQ